MTERILLTVEPSRAASAGTAAPSIVQAALEHWPVGDRPRVVSAGLEQVLAQAHMLDQAGVCWFIGSQADPAAAGPDDLVALLQEHLVPCLLTCPGAPEAFGTLSTSGATVVPLSAPAAAVAALLRGLWNQNETMDAVRRELHYLRAHEGGLCQQLDRMDEDLRLAARLQRELLPGPLTGVAGFAFDALYRPAGHVSGDIYDVFELDADHVGLFLADAVGHGTPAALLTMYLKHALRVRDPDPQHPLHDRIVPPADALSRLNREITHRRGSGTVRTATAWYGVLERHSGVLEHARAGHPHPILFSADGHARTLGSDGPLLGVFPDEQFVPSTVQLQPGDRLLIYSDGLEWGFGSTRPGAPPSTDSVSARLTLEFRDLAKGPVRSAMQRLAQRLDSVIGSLDQRDDMTVLCVEMLARHAPESSGAPGRVRPAAAA
jgi:sigma-B regulation protein RsbU (phosphoserine phosphatase)